MLVTYALRKILPKAGHRRRSVTRVGAVACMALAISVLLLSTVSASVREFPTHHQSVSRMISSPSAHGDLVRSIQICDAHRPDQVVCTPITQVTINAT